MDNTKENIVTAAFSLFMTKGYNEVSMNDILKKTGLSKGGFYHHFTSKEELYENVIDRFFFAAASDPGYQPSPELSFVENMDQFLERKEQAFKIFAHHLGVEHSEINFFMFIMQAIKNLAGVRQKLELFMYREKQQIEHIIDIAVRRDELRSNIVVSQLADQIIAMFDGTEMHGVILSQSFETIRKEKTMIRHLYEWIRKQ
jgi:TetR/AcrR family transcriptional regulator, transcriptional repressor for nem operon